MNKGLVTTYALAATKKEINQNWTDKEFREQKIVEEQITNDLSKYCNSIEKGALQTIKAGSIYHLKSVLKAKTKTHPFDLINILHPTPAVAGTPKKEAINYINEKLCWLELFVFFSYLLSSQCRMCGHVIWNDCKQIECPQVKNSS